MTKEIYRTWRVKNYGKPDYGRSVEYKHAIVDYFKDHAKVLIVTDAGSEGLNLQFCNTILNYDLPWNPQKIEQRIGRCHQYDFHQTFADAIRYDPRHGLVLHHRTGDFRPVLCQRVDAL